MRRRRRLRRVFYSGPVIFLLLLLVVVTLGPVWRIYEKWQRVAREGAVIDAELNRWAERKRILESNLQFLSTARSVEAEIREKFSVVKEGEKVIAVLPRLESATTTATTTPFWQRWLDLLSAFGGLNIFPQQRD